MNISDLALRIILLFLPGIISWFIIEKLIISRKREFSYFIVYSFLLAFLSYYSYDSFLLIINIFFKTSYYTEFFSFLVNTNEPLKVSIFSEILKVSGIAFIFSLILAFFINKRTFHKILQKCTITKRFSEPDLWSYIVNSDNYKWIYFRDFKNRKIYRGKLVGFSDTLGEITEVKWKIFAFMMKRQENLFMKQQQFILQEIVKI